MPARSTQTWHRVRGHQSHKLSHECACSCTSRQCRVAEPPWCEALVQGHVAVLLAVHDAFPAVGCALFPVVVSGLSVLRLIILIFRAIGYPLSFMFDDSLAFRTAFSSRSRRPRREASKGFAQSCWKARTSAPTLRTLRCHFGRSPRRTAAEDVR